MAAIAVRGLTKRYGRVQALRGVHLEVETGGVFGFLGPNGAGKTTTMRILLDLIRPSSGTVAVLGVDPRGNPSVRERIGYLPGEPSLPDRLTARHYLGYLGSLRESSPTFEPLATRFGLPLDRPIRTLSRGNKQKVALVQAFMYPNELYVLDEPTSGLDPLLQQEFRALVREVVADGATVFLSSHVLAEVEQLTERVAIVRDGVVIDVEDVEALRHKAGQQISLTFSQAVDPALIAVLPGVSDLIATGATVSLLLHGEPDALLRVVAPWGVVRLRAQERELEDLFMEFYR